MKVLITELVELFSCAPLLIDQCSGLVLAGFHVGEKHTCRCSLIREPGAKLFRESLEGFRLHLKKPSDARLFDKNFPFAGVDGDW